MPAIPPPVVGHNDDELFSSTPQKLLGSPEPARNAAHDNSADMISPGGDEQFIVVQDVKTNE